MKSPTSLQLTLMMGAAASLTACSETPQSFSSVSDCVRYGKPQALCQSAYDEALAEHVRSTPIFNSDEECRTGVDVNHCISIPVQRSDGTIQTLFAPLMAGYLIGTNINKQPDKEESSGGGSTGGGYVYNRRVYHGSPIYQSSRYTDGYWTSSELKTSKSSSASRHQPNIRTQTLARQGFGGRSFFGGG
jgi:uncharacterized protein YgiB involved in biofilm formation